MTYIKKTGPGRREVSFDWLVLPVDIPVIHQELEAVADLVCWLRSQGLQVVTRPTRTLHHGTPAVLTLHCEAQLMSTETTRKISDAYQEGVPDRFMQLEPAPEAKPSPKPQLMPEAKYPYIQPIAA